MGTTFFREDAAFKQGTLYIFCKYRFNKKKIQITDKANASSIQNGAFSYIALPIQKEGNKDNTYCM